MGNHIHKAWRKESQIREPPDLPVEILLDIFSRADPVTLLRCAATSKTLRRHITDPAFLHRLFQHADSDFVPSLLVGLFFYHVDVARHFVPVPPFAKFMLSLTPTDLDDPVGLYRYKPVVSRTGLVVLRRHTTVPGATTVVDLCVGNPMTGHYVFLPPSTVYGYSHVLLPGDRDRDEEEGTGCFFRLLVLDDMARTQTFSSRVGSWGAVAEPPAHLNLPHRFKLARRSAIVLHDTVHWLYHDDHGPSSQCYSVLAISVSTGLATTIEVPQCCLRRRRREVTGELLLVRSVDGRLGLLVAEALGIAIWTLLEDSRSWVRGVVVDRARMLQSLTLHYHPLSCLDTELEWFGESSGTVVLQLGGAGILLLDLQTGDVNQFSKGKSICSPLRCCPYEIDLVSLLALMKSF